MVRVDSWGLLLPMARKGDVVLTCRSVTSLNMVTVYGVRTAYHMLRAMVERDPERGEFVDYLRGEFGCSRATAYRYAKEIYG